MPLLLQAFASSGIPSGLSPSLHQATFSFKYAADRLYHSSSGRRLATAQEAEHMPQVFRRLESSFDFVSGSWQKSSSIALAGFEKAKMLFQLISLVLAMLHFFSGLRSAGGCGELE